jgi:NO-binding membrane sensor protein with MHYT domain
MRVPLIDFDYRLVVLSSFIAIIAMYATLAVVERMNSSRGIAWLAWLGGGASAMGIGIWSMHYLGLKALGLPVLALNNSVVPLSILAAIFASGVTLLVVSGKSDSGGGVKEESRRPIRLKSSSVAGWSDCV